MNGTRRPLTRIVLGAMLLLGAWTIADASVPTQIGPYRVRITSEPGVIPVGRARLRFEIEDASGRPVEGARIRSLVTMPGMSMGEKEAIAQPVVGAPGTYTSDATFAMAGGYQAAISIDGPLGEASGTVALTTGQNTESGSSGFMGGSSSFWLIAILVALLAAFTVFRMRKTGQRIPWQSALNRGTISGVLLLIAAFAVSRYAISHWRRPGAMTPIEAQVMEMNTPAPPGVAPVTLVEATRGPIENTVSYSGQVVAFNQQDVIARTEGWLDWMPFYVGQKVRANDIVAKLDISVQHAHLGESEAAVAAASQGVKVSQSERFQALAEADRARAEHRGRMDALAGADAEIARAREERAEAEAALDSRQSMIADAEAMVAAMKADRDFWQQQNARNKTLLDKGALSAEEYQRDAAMTANAMAKLQQAEARSAQAQAEVRAAEASIRKADAMITASEKRRQQMASDVEAADAAVRAAEASADVSAEKIEAARAAAAQARANLETVTVTHGFTEIRTLISGVITERVISPGQLVSPGQVILRVAQTDPVRLQANVAEVDLARIKTGSRFVVRDPDGGRPPFAAAVTSIAPAVDPATRTGMVEAIAANPDGRFIPGQFISVLISTGRGADALRVPTAALRTRTLPGSGALAEGARRYVWVADASGTSGHYTVRAVDVETGLSDGENVEITTGLEPGQKVVVQGGAYLRQGDMVFSAGNGVAR